MTELNLHIEFNCEKKNLTIDVREPLKFFFHCIREIFKRNNTIIANKKLILYYGYPIKRLYEHDIDSKNTLADLSIENYSKMKIEIDNENYFTEKIIQNPNLILQQQRALDVFSEFKTNTNAEGKNEKKDINQTLSISENTNIGREEKKEEPIIFYGKNKLVRRLIPADNSCLFSSINYCYYGLLGDPMVMRELISARIMSDTNLFNEAILEKKPEDYCSWIMDKNSWGGGIELSIIPSILNVKIGVVSIKDLAIEYFGENYETVIFILYNGIHYDSVVRITEKGDIGIFSAKDKSVEEDLIEMAKDLKAKNEFADMKNYKLKCNDCFIPFKENNDAIEHSKSTGHTNFQPITT